MHIRNIIHTLRPIRASEREAIQRLRGKIEKLETRGATADSLSVWQKNVADLRRQIAQSDPRFFLEWNTVRYSMVHESKPTELDYVRAHTNWPRWKRALIESPVGNPKPYAQCRNSSGNSIHQAYSLAQITNFAAFDPSHAKVIMEFGGGYGSMARLIFRLGFTGTYIIFDLPEFLYLQEYYITSASDIRVQTLPTAENGPIVILLSDLEKVKTQTTISGQPDLFIALWSLSEAPITLRDEIMNIVGDAKNYLVSYQDTFEGIDNDLYFTALKKNMPQCEWSSYPITHLKGAHHYLVGAAKK